MSDNSGIGISVNFFEIPQGKNMIFEEMRDKNEVSAMLDICNKMENNGIAQVNEPLVFESSTGSKIVTAEYITVISGFKIRFAIISGKGEIGGFEDKAKEFLLDKRFIDDFSDDEEEESYGISDLYFEDGITKIKANTFEDMPILYKFIGRCCRIYCGDKSNNGRDNQDIG